MLIMPYIKELKSKKKPKKVRIRNDKNFIRLKKEMVNIELYMNQIHY